MPGGHAQEVGVGGHQFGAPPSSGAGVTAWRTQMGQWWATNLAASSSAAIRYGPNSSSTVAVQAPMAGTITAITVRGDAAITAGSTSAIVQVTINGTAKTAAGEILTVAATLVGDKVVLASPIAVAAGDLIGVRIVTDVGWTATSWDPTVDLTFSGTT